MNLFLLIAAVILALFTVAAAAGRRRAVRSGTPIELGRRTVDRYELAYLAGGPVRAAETAVALLVSSGAVRLGSGGRIYKVKRGPAGEESVENVVINLVVGRSGRNVAVLKSEVAGSIAVDAIRRRLAEDGLVVGDGGVWRLRAWARRLLVTAVAAVIGAAFAGVGLSVEPRSYALLALLVFGGTAVAAGIMLRGHRRSMAAALTPAGQEVLDAARRAANADDEATSIALHGTAALRDDTLRKELRRQSRRPAHAGRTPARRSSGGYVPGGATYGASSGCGGGGCGGGSSSCGGGSGCGGGGCGGGS
ncbi:TIGR04222 domain-containing membrane protein [Nonomuraea sp. NPDC049421]|uniref:TIGR04222 domain-containing membrane protein n=1 Tax=Nonomuraea sp. NPDC049421 TaxID=3155275 RepID=UPI0034380D3A